MFIRCEDIYKLSGGTPVKSMW